MLYLVGLGLGDAADITVKGLEAVRSCSRVYLEAYTSVLTVGKEALEQYYGKQLILADRDLVEQGADEILKDADVADVAFLVVGDPFGATTHSDLVLRAVNAGIPYKIIHNASIMTVSSNLSVMAAKSSNVCCLASVSALPTQLKSSVRLTVVAEVVQEGDDCTVPLAVTASLSALLLLLLLCICTVLCYRQRRQAKPSPQAAIWFDQSEIGKRSVAEVTAGEVNLGYSSEGPTDADYNELIMTTHSQKDFASFRKAPDVVHCSSLSVHSESQEEENYKNIKRITTV